MNAKELAEQICSTRNGQTVPVIVNGEWVDNVSPSILGVEALIELGYSPSYAWDKAAEEQAIIEAEAYYVET